MPLKSLVRKFTPTPVLLWYHRTMALFAAVWFGHPSEQLIVIGVTGTKGKSTTSALIAQMLTTTGAQVGLTSTAVMKVGDKEWLNDRKMTMPGRFELQRLLRQMVDAGCTYAVIETSSEGIAQFRHIGIHYDTVVFTNLSPEHIESHGSYENYRASKRKLFEHLRAAPNKTLKGVTVAKRVVLNRNDKESGFFEAVHAGETWWFGIASGLEEIPRRNVEREVIASIVAIGAQGVALAYGDIKFQVPLLGKINAYNILAAMTVLVSLGVPLDTVLAAARVVTPVPGRQEFIREGQSFPVVVDYAYEPTSMASLYALLAVVPHEKLIQVLGSTGGGRDRWRRPVLGELAAHHADTIIVTTDDPYDDDPESLAEELLAGARPVKEERPQLEILKIADRREAIRIALARATPNDLVLITGKGAEQKMAIAGGKYIPWDDRAVAREELHSLSGKSSQ